MASRNLECPICHSKSNVSLIKGQTSHRCQECTRLVRVLIAPKKRKKKTKKKANVKTQRV